MTTPCMELKDIRYDYEGRTVVEHISLTVAQGDYLGVIGPNGGGKTTLIKIMLGLLTPDAGEIMLFGQRQADFRERYRLGYIPQKATQSSAWFPASVREIIQSGRTPRMGLFRRMSNDDRRAVTQAVDITGIGDLLKRPIGELSGGERQRVYIARALAAEPDVLILDEPVTGVDAPSQERFYRFLEHLNSEHGITIVFVSHDIGVMAREAKNVLCMNRTMFCHGSPEQFIKEEFLAELYGSRVASILHHHH